MRMAKGFKTKKYLGQHFLIDHTVIERIILSLVPQPTDFFIEIGPGQGALTRDLLPKVKQIDAVEFDADVLPYLQKQCKDKGRLVIHHADVLRFDFNTLPRIESTYRVVGNLPYNISTPLLFHLLDYAALFHDMCFMLQKEVADRITALPGCKDYGRLSVMIQYHCLTDALFDVPPSAFSPPPKVNSAVIRLVPRVTFEHKAQDYTLFATLVRDCFNQRRKTLRNTVKNYINTELLNDLAFDLGQRPEDVTVAAFVNLANAIKAIRQTMSH